MTLQMPVNNIPLTTPVSLVSNSVSDIDIEGINVKAFPSVKSLFDHIIYSIRNLRQIDIFSINVHGANLAHKDARFKSIMKNAEIMICDGAGIVLASKLLGEGTFPCRLAAGDYMPALLRRLAHENLTSYFLAGEPGVAKQALENLAMKVPHHTVLGCHHGYILKDKVLEEQVIEEINRLQPDILFVGFGMPLQEYWIDENRHRLNVKAFLPFGATLDYLSGKVERAPGWIGNLGCEWLFRLCLEPQRMFERYVMGNPYFLLRILSLSLKKRMSQSKRLTYSLDE